MNNYYSKKVKKQFINYNTLKLWPIYVHYHDIILEKLFYFRRYSRSSSWWDVELIMCQCHSKIFIVRPVMAFRPVSVIDYLRGRYYTISGVRPPSQDVSH